MCHALDMEKYIVQDENAYPINVRRIDEEEDDDEDEEDRRHHDEDEDEEDDDGYSP